MTATPTATLHLSEAQAHRAEDVCKKVVSRLGTFQQADKDDLVQGALVALAENPPPKDEDVGFCVIGYLMNLIYRYRDDALREDGRFENERERLRMMESDASHRRARTTDAKEAVEEALARAKLTPAQRLYVMAYLKGEKHSETARRFGVGRNAVWNRFHEALVKIAKVVEWPT